MLVLPVMDLRAGAAVHAAGGNRSRYPIVDGRLGAGHDPLALASAFRDRLGCRSLYVADLDAIAGGGAPGTLIAEMAGLGLRVWCDAGVRTARRAEALLAAGATCVIVGLETLASLDELGAIVRALGGERVAFSLDLREGRPIAAAPALLGAAPAELARAAADAGIEHLICLDLARVGSRAGPPLGLLSHLRSVLPATRCYAGGGVRSAADLLALDSIGCAGALVATALHDGRITREDIERVSAAPGS